MNDQMTSKERLLRAMSREAVDRLPIRVLIMKSYDQLPFHWKDQYERIQILSGYGIDDTIWLEPPGGYVENYRVNTSKVKTIVNYFPQGIRDERYPVLEKKYLTPEGDLSTVVRVTDDWPYGRDIPIFSDFNVSRAIRHIIQNPADLKALKYLLPEPAKEEIAEFNHRWEIAKRFSDQHGIAIEGGWLALGDAVVWLLGMEQTLEEQLLNPDLVEEIIDIVSKWEEKRAEILLDKGIDILVSMAWYEGVDTFVPDFYRKHIAPRLKRRSEIARSAGAKHRYIITSAYKPIIDDIILSGVDCISGFDPVQDNISWDFIMEKTRDRISVMGGLNASIMLSSWDHEKIVEAVTEAVEKAKQLPGFILYPVDQIFEDTDWSRMEIVLDTLRHMQ